MTYFHYYASTIRNLADVGKYAIYPAAYAAGLLYANKAGLSAEDKKKVAANYARVTTAIVYTGISSVFHAMESEMIDANSREAVATEMGISPDQVKYSDYGKSQNVLVKNAYEDGLKVQKYRYGTDLMFLIPTMIDKYFPTLPKMTSAQHGLHEWDMLPFAGKAAYWAGETFAMEKSGNYEIVKLRENLGSTGKDISANDVLGVYQRTRADKNLPLIESKAELDMIHPLMDKMAKEFNKREGFSLSEIVYLVGLNKINIHEADGKTVSSAAAEQSMREIEKVATIGLKGIRAENHSLHANDNPRPRTFVDRIADTAFDTSQKIITGITGKKRNFRPEEYISVRDPGEIVSWNFDINR
jgi:hypothetical protein